MKIELHYYDPTPEACKVAVAIDSEPVGTLTLRQRDILTFQMVLHHGLSLPSDSFRATGYPGPDPAEERPL